MFGPTTESTFDPSPLSERQKRVLGFVVREHVATAQPVASRVVAQRCGLAVSPATIRNDMLTLERFGLLTHPHTSAGRVPTLDGYRYYVAHIMDERRLSADQRLTIRHQFHQVGDSPQQWLRLSASVTAGAARSAAVVSRPHAEQTRLRHVELIEAEGGTQVILILSDGSVHQSLWTPDEQMTPEDVTRLANQLNQDLRFATQTELGARTRDLSPNGRALVQALEGMMARAQWRAAEGYVHAGLARALEEPEFADTGRMRALVDLLEHGTGLEQLMASLPQPGVHVIVGGEGKPRLDEGISLVLARIGSSHAAGGLLCAVGPVRMSYEQAVPAVRFVARLVNELLEALEGGSSITAVRAP